MLAYPWFAALQNFDESIWRKALNAHDILLAKLNELGSTAVISTRPIQDGHYRLNQAFCWSNCVYRPIR
ncbi:MAG: carbon-nitrogen hydrolase family protein, partial [Archaeoglobales archaeon]